MCTYGSWPRGPADRNRTSVLIVIPGNADHTTGGDDSERCTEGPTTERSRTAHAAVGSDAQPWPCSLPSSSPCSRSKQPSASTTRAIRRTARTPGTATPSGSATPGSTAARRTPTSPPWPAACTTPASATCTSTRARWSTTARSPGRCIRRPVGSSTPYTDELPGIRVQAFLGDVLADRGPGRHAPGEARHPRRRRRAPPARSWTPATRASTSTWSPCTPATGTTSPSSTRCADETRSRGVPLSVAAHQIDPLPAFHTMWGRVTGHPKWWSQEFFGQVARRVDQIAVMSYDTRSRWRAPTAATSPSRPPSPWRSPRPPPTC